MLVNRKGFNDTIALRLRMSKHTTAELRLLLSSKVVDAKTRKAAEVVLRVRERVAAEEARRAER